MERRGEKHLIFLKPVSARGGKSKIQVGEKKSYRNLNEKDKGGTGKLAHRGGVRHNWLRGKGVRKGAEDGSAERRKIRRGNQPNRGEKVLLATWETRK